MSVQELRPDAIYVSWQTRKGLNYVAKALGEVGDAIADQVLADWLKANHPQVVEHMRLRSKADDEFQDSLAKKLNPKPF